jgi:hypothetical protein
MHVLNWCDRGFQIGSYIFRLPFIFFIISSSIELVPCFFCAWWKAHRWKMGSNHCLFFLNPLWLYPFRYGAKDVFDYLSVKNTSSWWYFSNALGMHWNNKYYGSSWDACCQILSGFIPGSYRLLLHGNIIRISACNITWPAYNYCCGGEQFCIALRKNSSFCNTCV